MDLVETWFTEARQRWPDVAWSLDRFRTRVARRTPVFPVDLFLAGAASERVDAAWIRIDGEFRQPVCFRLREKLRADLQLCEDSWQMTMATLIQPRSDPTDAPEHLRPLRIAEYEGRTTLLGYLAVIAGRKAIDQLRRLRSEAARSARSAAGEPAVTDPSWPDAEEREAARSLASDFVSAFGALAPSQRVLLRLVFGQGLRKREAGEVLGLRDYEVSRQLQSAIKALQKSLKGRAPQRWDEGSVGIMMRAWAVACSQEEGTDA